MGLVEGELFPIDDLAQRVSKNSVRWYAEYEGARVELETEQLLNPRHLERVFMDKAYKADPTR